jgi:hypothetical protein
LTIRCSAWRLRRRAKDFPQRIEDMEFFAAVPAPRAADRANCR